MTALIALLLASAFVAQADLNQIRTDPNLERRAHAALAHASECFDEAKAAYAAGNAGKTGQQLIEMENSVELARDALNETGKDPRRHVRPFKMAETETRELLRRLGGLETAMDFEDRKLIAEPKEKIQEVHDEWLNEIISGRR